MMMLNVTNTAEDTSLGIIYKEDTNIQNSTLSTQKNSVTNIQGRFFIPWITMSNTNENRTFGVKGNHTNSSVFRHGINVTFTVDSTLPVIQTLTTDLNILVNNNYSITVNVTELYDFYVQVTSNDTAITYGNFTINETDSDIWHGSVNYTSPYSHRLTFTAEDKAGHTKTFNQVIKSSNVSQNPSGVQYNNSFNYNTTFLTIGDAATFENINLKNVLNITSYGDAYINDFNTSFSIVIFSPLG